MPAQPTSAAELAKFIDHTLLKPEATRAQIDRLCREALEYDFAAVCVNPFWVEECVSQLQNSSVQVATVAGFPLGASLPEIKAAEAKRAVQQGASEVDMVVNLGALIAGDKTLVQEDIWQVVAATRQASESAIVKVILETAALSDEQIILGCRCAAEAQAAYVKTSTGFHPAGGATVEHVALLHKHASPIKVKASGGIRDLQSVRAMIEAGASRLGMSAGIAVMQELAAQ
ncbi:MAG: deoxyribose-phosphate aldolase [Phycisphaerae bacterium]